MITKLQPLHQQLIKIHITNKNTKITQEKHHTPTFTFASGEQHITLQTMTKNSRSELLHKWLCNDMMQLLSSTILYWSVKKDEIMKTAFSCVLKYKGYSLTGLLNRSKHNKKDKLWRCCSLNSFIIIWYLLWCLREWHADKTWGEGLCVHFTSRSTEVVVLPGLRVWRLKGDTASALSTLPVAHNTQGYSTSTVLM